MLLRAASGEHKVWSVVQVPSVEAEDARQLVREIESVQAAWTAQRNRMQGLLAAHGAVVPLTRGFLDRLADAQTGDGRPLPAGLRARLAREWAFYQVLEARREALAAERVRLLAEEQTRVAEVARRLAELRGIGDTSAVLFSAELFGTRTFNNGREIGALSGYAPVPYRSDRSVADQGISRRGRAALRRVGTQVAWCWIRWQRKSALTQWFHARFATAGKRARRVGIVAVARKLLIALWRYSAHGVIPDGAELKAVSGA